MSTALLYCTIVITMAQSPAQTKIHVQYEDRTPARSATVNVYNSPTATAPVATLETDPEGNAFFQEPTQRLPSYWVKAEQDQGHFSSREEIRWHLPEVSPTLTIRTQGVGVAPTTAPTNEVAYCFMPMCGHCCWSPCCQHNPCATQPCGAMLMLVHVANYRRACKLCWRRELRSLGAPRCGCVR